MEILWKYQHPNEICMVNSEQHSSEKQQNINNTILIDLISVEHQGKRNQIKIVGQFDIIMKCR